LREVFHRREVFGGPLTVQLPGSIPKIGGGSEPRPPYTVTSVTGIASNRTSSGTNLLGLDFYTSILGIPGVRMSITSAGLVGVGTQTPSRAVEIRSAGDVELGLMSKDSGGRLWTIQSSGVVSSGTNVPLNGSFQIIDRTAGVSRMQIDPATGMVSVGILRITGGADLAEPFAMSDNTLRPGSVVVIDEEHEGELRLSSTPYDRRVAGVISGAGGVHPALMLTQAVSPASGAGLDTSQNVALSGRVYVLADASGGSTAPGDLLTTSSTHGRCMKASDYERARGAILGKAMSSLSEGRGLILALVTLQ
jgi:hypothetical protein